MTEDRLMGIALEMELPLNSLDCLDAMLIELVENARTERPAMLYSLLQRNLGPDPQELRKLWKEFFVLAGGHVEKPTLKSVEE